MTIFLERTSLTAKRNPIQTLFNRGRHVKEGKGGPQEQKKMGSLQLLYLYTVIPNSEGLQAL